MSYMAGELRGKGISFRNAKYWRECSDKKIPGNTPGYDQY